MLSRKSKKSHLTFASLAQFHRRSCLQYTLFQWPSPTEQRAYSVSKYATETKLMFPLARSTLCENIAPTTVTVISTHNQSQVETITQIETTTITEQPGTVTVALQDPDAISSSLSSALSVESQQLEINSQLAPINPHTSTRPPPPPSATRFTRTIVVPVVEATKATSATDVYFIGESNGTTTWLTNFIPHESMTIGTTTVTLSPVPSVSAGPANASRSTERSIHTSIVTITTSRPGSLSLANGGALGNGEQGWNSTALAPATAMRSGCSTDGTGLNASSPFTTVTVRRSSVILTTTAQPSTSPIIPDLPADAYGSTVNITFPTADYSHRKRAVEDNRRKAVCEWVTATMRGTPVSWRNNWDGSRTVNCATVGPSGSIVQSQSTLRKCCDSELSVKLTPIPAPTLATITVTVPETSSMEEAPVSSPANPMEMIIPASATTKSPPAATASCGVSGDFTLDVFLRNYPPFLGGAQADLNAV